MIALVIAAALGLVVLVGFVMIVVSIHRADRAMSASLRDRMATGYVGRGVSWT
ncbi:hypothetical protein ACFXJ8_40725 [Nonomuraea sp. NPDC059194]|uniref:hypothetical protein n=1 Tax=Nonomuraea sp. NPDC059194 TaxID=3346764 RepID=UPI0036CDC346